MPVARELTSRLASIPGLSEPAHAGIPTRNRPTPPGHADQQGQIAMLRARLAVSEKMVRTPSLLSTAATNRTELREANRSRDRNERDNRTKDKFMATLAHELRSPLGAISIGLPRMDGYQVASRIRAERHGRDILLVALTGGDGPRDATRSLRHDFDHHLVKPVDLDYLACLLSSSRPLKEISL